MIVKVVVPDSIYANVYFARGAQGPQGATGPQGVQGAQGPTGLTGPAGANGTNGVSYTPGDPIYVTARNATGSLLTKGSIVYVSGANGNHVQVTLAQAIGDITSARTIGWVADNIANNADGLIMVEGYLEGLNTSGLTAGSQLYLSPTVPGGFTATKPTAPDHMVYVGVAVKISSGDGHVYVKVQNGYELSEIHDVKITSPVNNQVLTYDSATDLWINATNPADGVTSITAASPLTGGTITSTGSIGLDQSLLAVTQSQVTGLVTALAGKANLAGGNAFTGAQTIGTSAIGNIGLQVNAFTGQTADLAQFRDASSTVVTKINSAGLFSTTRNVTVAGSNAGENLFIIRGASGQTGDLLKLQNNSAVDVLNVSPTGTLKSSGLITAGSNSSVLGQLTVITTAASRVGAVIQGAASQTANLQEWQNSAGTVLASLSSAGVLTLPNASVNAGGVVRAVQLSTNSDLIKITQANSGAQIVMTKQTASATNPGASQGALYFRDGTVPGTLKLVVRAGAAGAETTILDNIPQ